MVSLEFTTASSEAFVGEVEFSSLSKLLERDKLCPASDVKSLEFPKDVSVILISEHGI